MPVGSGWTWLGLGAGATVLASAGISASAVLYRGSIFADEKEKLRDVTSRETEGRGSVPGAESSRNGTSRVHHRGHTGRDGITRAQAIPTATKALAISTLLVASVGSLSVASLLYLMDRDGSSTGNEDTFGERLKGFLTDRFKDAGAKTKSEGD
mmetsp:Transcript_10957/g.27676  ORF Transcript_10957/g.27676 Transcript_10957/m.27676 type:complete len:154 (+) Transcript_10957:552-1013(+)